jgi:acetyl esterase/lipase
MRAARDDLLLAYAPLDGSTELSQISADGVRFEVVRAAAAASEDARVLILVHGGIFMLGSPKGWRHLAERFSAALRVPVVLPALRLAPEHTFPAPLDDLAAAYRHVATHGARTAPDSGVGATPPSHIALFAESSGAGIALSMLQARLEAREEPMPCAVVLVSPWLDLTCSSQSFRRNARSDPVIKKEALLNIAQVYLGRAGAGAASAASPLRAPSKVFSRMPPTLIHVDARESLLDDSRRLEAKLRSANAPVRLREWRSTLHGWHALYPIFEPAEEAIADVVSFLSDHLFEQG